MPRKWTILEFMRNSMRSIIIRFYSIELLEFYQIYYLILKFSQYFLQNIVKILIKNFLSPSTTKERSSFFYYFKDFFEIFQKNIFQTTHKRKISWFKKKSYVIDVCLFNRYLKFDHDQPLRYHSLEFIIINFIIYLAFPYNQNAFRILLTVS